MKFRTIKKFFFSGQCDSTSSLEGNQGDVDEIYLVYTDTKVLPKQDPEHDPFKLTVNY